MTTRNRTNGISTELQVPFWWNGASSVSHNGPGVGTVKAMTDEVIPKFFARRKAGEVFMNPMTYTVKNFSLATASALDFTMIEPTWPYYNVSCRWGDSLAGWRFSFLSNPTISGNQLPASVLSLDAQTIESLITEASTKALAQRGQSQTNLWETVAEMDKSLKMVPDMFNEVRNIVKKTARVHYSRNVKSLYSNVTASRIKTLNTSGVIGRKMNAAANLYLAYRYGIKPIMSDLDGIFRGLGRANGIVRQTSRGVATTSTSQTVELLDPFAVGGYVRINFNHKTYRKLTVSARAMSLDEYNIGALFNMGFSAKGLAVLPWELIPFSFVIDWVANVGDMLGAILPSSAARALGSCVVLESDEYISATTNSTSATIATRQDVPDVGEYSGHIITRERTPGALYPGLVIKSDFRLTNLTRVCDAASLLLQTMKHPYR